MSATCVLWYVPCANAPLHKIPRVSTLSPNLVCVCARGGEGVANDCKTCCTSYKSAMSATVPCRATMRRTLRSFLFCSLCALCGGRPRLQTTDRLLVCTGKRPPPPCAFCAPSPAPPLHPPPPPAPPGCAGVGWGLHAVHASPKPDPWSHPHHQGRGNMGMLRGGGGGHSPPKGGGEGGVWERGSCDSPKRPVSNL